jgi:hypothetical protein
VEWDLRTPRSIRSVAARFVADSILLAHSIAPSKWGMTPFADGSLRLNVGFTEVLTVELALIRILAIDEDLPAKLDRAGISVRRRGKSFYKSVPGSVLIEVSTDVESLKDVLRQIEAAHHHAIQLASRRGVGKGVRDGHSELAVRRIGELAATPLPTPTYASSIDPTPFPTQKSAQRDDERENDLLYEATLRRSQATERERNPRARALCIAHHGSKCTVCGFDFGETYGALGSGFIEVHHLSPLSSAQARRSVDPVKDLVPVCSNCHRMLHRREPPLTPAELADSRHLVAPSASTRENRRR